MKYKIQLFLCFFFIIKIMFSQKEIPLNNPIYDNQSYHFGFTLGLSQNKFQINYSKLFVEQTNFEQILSQYQSGFNVGIIIDLRLNQNYNLRITPSFNFSDQKLYYTSDNIVTTIPKTNSGVSNFEIPIYFKYRSDRINNGRTYILCGTNYMVDMSGLEKLTQTTNLKFSKTNYSLDIGFGIDIYFTYFKFSPEIKYSYGMKNILEKQNNQYDELIETLSTRSILISLTFE